MDLSNLHMTLKAYQKVSRSILSDYVTKPELSEKLEGYVEELPEETQGDGNLYGRQYKQWIPIDFTYRKPEILVFELIGLKDVYQYGETVEVTGIMHQESNLEHIIHLRLLRDGDVIAEINPSKEVITEEITDSFTITGNTLYKFEIESDIGNLYYQTKEVYMERMPYMYTGVSNKTVMTAEDVLELPEKDIKEDTKYRYVVTEPSYVWWCASEKIVMVQQDGLYPIDLVESEVVIDGKTIYCYRVLDELANNVWRFTITLDHEDPDVKVGDLRIGGSMDEHMNSTSIQDILTRKDFEENKIYSINTTTECYLWVCCPYDVDIMDAAGNYIDFELVDTGIDCGRFTFNCYRSTYVMSAENWLIKCEKIQ